MDPADLVSLDDMERAAHAVGFEGVVVKRRLNEYQGFGLVGKPVRKAPRRGGEGLWHPNQLVLFLDVLDMRERQKLRLPTIANRPVGLWRMSVQGISTEQVQRAMSYWGGFLPGVPSGVGQPGRHRTGGSKSERRPAGERSIRRKAVDQAVATLSAPGASDSAKRELRALLEIVNDTGVAASPDTWARASLGVMAPGADASPQQRWVADAQFRGQTLQMLAVRHLDLLCAPSAMALWDWARAVDQKHRPEYVAEQARMVTDPEVRHLYSRPLEYDIQQQGCHGLLTILGIGLALLWGEYGMSVPAGEEPPPSLKIKRRP